VTAENSRQNICDFYRTFKLIFIGFWRFFGGDFNYRNSELLNTKTDGLKEF
jgi:hypothetical protein